MAKKVKDKLVGSTIDGVYIERYFYISYENKPGGRNYFDCICECGVKFTCRSDHLSKSCGCKTGAIISAQTSKPNAINNKLFREYKLNAKRKNLDFLLSKIDFNILIKQNCYYCGQTPTERNYNSGRKNRLIVYFSWNGIDRAANYIGYIKENCVTCCINCNRAKNNLELKEFELWLDNLAKYRLSIYRLSIKNIDI